ncbi:hypothetical protein M413DRAFT_122048 [Hebeloma cylindrosporum]|uniref:Fungal-type protein kinase domain-containing protein n=1 Tax=Hebeloma cylindrosporum TaxID=76867 RepID=A0A0C3C1F7_HEBCY|nr:hypothetical protein M413DRAFT_122048 [Hebeloma cylindrosporum h7]
MPHSHGSAAQTLVDERYTSFYCQGSSRAGNLKNIRNVAYDLKSRERCSFITMLKALMLRQAMMKDGSSRKDFTATAEEWEAVDQIFRTYLNDAVGFVNGPHGKPMRRELKAYCETATETPRYPHFVNTLNEMLLYFRKLKSRTDAIEDGDIIFAINDPAVVESHHLPKTSTKRKPDLICLLAKRFRHLFNGGRFGIKACMKTAASLQAANKKLEPDAKATWGDILQSWELQAKRQINSEIRTDFTVEEFLSGDEAEISAAAIDELPVASTSTSEVQASATSGVKRKRGSSYVPSSKKIKVDDSDFPPKLRAPKDVQCAFYGIERLRHSMDITHSMTVLLSDANLTLSWYDSQGCIEADRINIIEALPLLAVMIRIFEDFPLGMWGYTPVEIWSEDKSQKKTPYRRNENPVGSFQIIGRRTFTADATKVQPTTQTATTPTTALNRRRSTRLSQRGAQPQPSTSGEEHFSGDAQPDEPTDDILFLKSAWPETKRCKEPEVILEAYKPANELLGTEARSVTDHLPVLVNSRELSYTSTEIIRQLVKSTTTQGFRVQLWMLSKKLQPIHALAPVDFWKAFWQTLRCHALLWRIGIAHGDVSLYNLMSKEDNKYGVLNDFDLSTIMKPGDQNPNRQGLERTGTLPFMALQLLDDEGFDGKVPRRYRHELESFAWILVWVSRCVVGGEECELPRCLKKWLGHDIYDVMGSKVTFIHKQLGIPMTSDYLWLESALFSWMSSWGLLDQQCQGTNPLRHPPEKTDSEHLQTFIAICKECATANPTVSIPIDITWVDGLADLKFTIHE